MCSDGGSCTPQPLPASPSHSSLNSVTRDPGQWSGPGPAPYPPCPPVWSFPWETLVWETLSGVSVAELCLPVTLAPGQPSFACLWGGLRPRSLSWSRAGLGWAQQAQQCRAGRQPGQWSPSDPSHLGQPTCYSDLATRAGLGTSVRWLNWVPLPSPDHADSPGSGEGCPAGLRGQRGMARRCALPSSAAALGTWPTTML